MLNSNIEDNELFKQLKIQNNLLLENNKKLNEDNEKINQRIRFLENNDNVDISNINEEINSINIDSKINDALKTQKDQLYKDFSIERDKIKNEYKILLNSIKEEKNKVINELQSKLDKSNKHEKHIKNKIDKYSEESLYNSVYIYEDISLPYQEFRASKTYRKLLDELEFHNKLNNINYDDIVYWINKNEKTHFKSSYFKNKYERSKIILDKYKDKLYKLKNLKFSISYISNMSDNKFNDWLFVLDDKLNNFYNEQ
jgi:hypothetical protein